MANLLTLQATKFINLPGGEESLGFCLHDDYDTTYVNIVSDIPDNDFEFLQLVLKDYINEQIDGMFLFCQENEKGLSINGNYYEWEEISHLFTD